MAHVEGVIRLYDRCHKAKCDCPSSRSDGMQILQELPRLAAEQEQKCEELAAKLMDLQEGQQKTEKRLERATQVCLLPSLLSLKACCLCVGLFWCVLSSQHMPSH